MIDLGPLGIWYLRVVSTITPKQRCKTLHIFANQLPVTRQKCQRARTYSRGGSRRTNARYVDRDLSRKSFSGSGNRAAAKFLDVISHRGALLAILLLTPRMAFKLSEARQARPSHQPHDRMLGSIVTCAPGEPWPCSSHRPFDMPSPNGNGMRRCRALS